MNLLQDRPDMIFPAATEQPDEFVPERHWRWLVSRALVLDTDSNLSRDDIAQEGLIAMWLSHGKFKPGKGTSYLGWLHMVADRRMAEIASGRKQPVGHQPVPGHWEPRHGERMFSLGAMDEGSPAYERIVGRDALDSVEDAYHHGVIHEALAQLPQAEREYVVLRFWGGLEPRDRSQRGSTRAQRAAYDQRAATERELSGGIDHTQWPRIRQTLAGELANLEPSR
ncbi:MAG: sigma factor [Nocardioides sp.]